MNHAIVLAAGEGKRSNCPNKLMELIEGKPLFEYSLEVFLTHPQIERVVLVVNEPFMNVELDKKIVTVLGGETRQESAVAGFKALGSLNPEDLILFHNAANPFVTLEEITKVIVVAQETGAACVAHPVTDTLKQVESQHIIGTLDRSAIWQAQTPQAMSAELYQKAIDRRFEGTDEMMLAEALNIQPAIVLASENNFKITTARDLQFARFLIEGAGSSSGMRTGIGQDSHRFDREHRGLTLGGIELPNEPKIIANSDGDVMIHALCNAILQALGEGSLGTIADEMLSEEKVTDSRKYLERVLNKVSDRALSVKQVGFQLEGSIPKIDPISDQLKASLAGLLNLSLDQIGITATTGEDLTPFGRGEGLQCFATVMLG